ncbi:ABC-2 transporter permease [Lysinibacillus xylanilyticus]|uniref:ABC-2 transporter permease n=1 Tax=Lysinibacillus xylanilyticus TaxID=582475 RepID=UPI003CFC83A9
MVNLILKDIIIQKNTIIIYIATIILYLLADVSPIFLGVLYSVVFIMNTFSVDDKGNANILLNSLPYTRKEVVSSKYMGALIFTSVIIFIIYLGDFFLNGKGEVFLWREILLIIGLVMVTTSFILPISYKFKSKHLVMILVALVGLYLVTVTLLIPNLHDILREVVQNFLALQETQMYFVAILTTVILYIGSWLLSIRIYERKAF